MIDRETFEREMADPYISRTYKEGLQMEWNFEQAKKSAGPGDWLGQAVCFYGIGTGLGVVIMLLAAWLER